MASHRSAEATRGLEQAFRLCSEAIDILDASGAPAQVAPHLEMAIQEIRRALADSAGHVD